MLSMLIWLLSSCHTIATVPELHSRDSTHLRADYRLDSIYIDRWHTLTLRGDTLVRTDSIYIEKRRTLTRTDTITLIRHDSIPYPVEVIVPTDSPVPRFYKGCAWFTFITILLFIGYLVLHLYLR